MIPLAVFCAAQIGALAAFAGAAYCLGSTVLRSLGLASWPERLVLSTIFGLGSLGTAFFVLGSFGVFNRPMVLAVLGACFATAWPRRHAAAPAISLALKSCRTVRGAGPWLIGTIVLVSLFGRALYPALDFDTTMYHLPVSKAFATAGSLPALTDLRYPVFPQFNELLCAGGLLLAGDRLTPLISSLCCLLVVGSLAAWAARIADRRVGAWSAALWLGSPLVLFLAGTGDVELGLATFATAAILAVDVGVETGDRRWYSAAGAFAGWAAATKYTGLYFVVALAVVLLATGPRRSRRGNLGVFGLCAVAAAGPWYARSLVLSGNPVWPFLGELFGYRFWTAQDVASLTWTLRQYGGPRTPGAFLRLPLTLGWTQPHGEDRLVPLPFALFPIGAVAAALSPRRRWLLGLAIGYFGFWFLTTQQVRFLLPVVPLLCFLAADGISRLADWLLPSSRTLATVALTSCAVGLLVAPGLLELGRKVVSVGPPPLDGASRGAFLSRRFASYPLYQRLNEKHGGRYTIYAFHDEAMKYFCDGTQLGDWFGRGRYSDVDLSTGQQLLRSLRRLGAGYLLVNDAAGSTRLPRDSFFAAHFVPIFRGPRVTAFEIR